MIPTPSTAIHQWSQIIAGLGTVILTIFLVILYRGQRDQLAARHEAVLEVTEVEWYRDKAIIWISNFGNGVAKDLFLTTLVKSNTGDHQTYALRSQGLKRIDKQGTWTNLIQPGEEDIPFHGKSVLGSVAPQTWARGWVPISFSTFVRRAKGNGSTEVKFCHVVNGVELSGDTCWDRLEPMDQIVNPQDFNRTHSLSDLPSVTKSGASNAFYPYFRESTIRNFAVRIYARALYFINKLFPRIKLRPRPLDASGTKRVKRVLLKRQLEQKADLVRQRVPEVLTGENWRVIIPGKQTVMILFLVTLSMIVGWLYFPPFDLTSIFMSQNEFVPAFSPILPLLGPLSLALTGLLSAYLVFLLRRE